ncbi:glycosyltransferase family 2 protein [Candidatus Pelagibacter bacterium]|jgi:glycosyltransferase involved in cell wall biosynthesis|nr:glycosyltransferase family 2 protein [Candidatus Pelagibacter bacterium]|tara:strand:+ start:4240 stop:4905 length:666 start_codon:yes stop_codon:yes gene_type:complete
MKKIPDISVIICCYNHDKWIERAIRSVLNQSYVQQSDIEIILVNDASKDNTKKIIKLLKGIPNLKVINNKKNIGLPKSINKAIVMSLGRYVVRLDSDDYFSRNYLYISRFFLEMNREYQAVATDYIKVDDKEKELEKVNCLKEQIACGVMFRKECLFDIGLYNDKFKMREGHELRIRFEEKFKIGRLEFPMYKYRIHNSNRTNTKKKILKKYDKLISKLKR